LGEGQDTNLLTALFANFLAKAVCNLGLEIGHILEHVLQDNDLAHGSEPTSVLPSALATDDLTLAAGLCPAAAVGVGLPAPLLDLHAQRVDDAGLVGAETCALGPAVFSHQARGEAGLPGAA
jgi:hypothetical protein